MKDQSIWQIIEHAGIQIAPYERETHGWSFAIETAALSTRRYGPYVTREDALRAALAWLVATAIEYWRRQAPPTDLDMTPLAPREAAILTLELQLEDEACVRGTYRDETVMELIFDPTTVVYNEAEARAELRSHAPGRTWCLWKNADGVQWELDFDLTYTRVG